MLPKGYLIGNLTADPVPGITNTSLDYSRFSVACNENYTRANQAAKTHYFSCIAWGKRAQYISTYLKKGDSVFIEFTLLTNNYTNIEGRTIKRIDLQVEKIELLFGKLQKSFSAGNLATESNIEERELLKEQEESLMVREEPVAQTEDGQEEEGDVELDDIFNMGKDDQES
ncbi:single-stranded DNA-binding protein [Candidatus Mycoplasma haematolamae str. Purdue]|uniref:Single-stranded DNA-binding protein n=1 Tax=Mycoplasma haematolamae (strain Purdue) TaxID=1212765 RepID=I7BIF1_MYCHA|nr:single-stranded DNA-binding protein [Candidatus Mycoplasma haematolamae]AFO51598.1 single-stranded DNA-binding protein [Candidatus Mycoplasma haematolamae str. Purdue]